MSIITRALPFFLATLVGCASQPVSRRPASSQTFHDPAQAEIYQKCTGVYTSVGVVAKIFEVGLNKLLAGKKLSDMQYQETETALGTLTDDVPFLDEHCPDHVESLDMERLRRLANTSLPGNNI